MPPKSRPSATRKSGGPTRRPKAGPSAGRASAKPGPRTSRSDAARPARGESSRPPRGESTRPARSESARPARSESARPARNDNARPPRGEGARRANADTVSSAPSIRPTVKARAAAAPATAARPAPRATPTAGKGGQDSVQTKVKWTRFRIMNDFFGQPMKRYYQLETLASATEAALRWKNSFLFNSMHEALGPLPIAQMDFELFQEGRYQLIFRMRALNTKFKPALFAFVAAKNHEECSKVAETEHHILRTLYARMPKFVTQPYWGGKVTLPDRHHRKENERHVYVYLTGWLNGYEELGVTRSLQFYVNAEKKHTFSLEETEVIRGQILEIVASSYDEASRTAMTLPQLASGDFVVNRNNGIRIKLIACRSMQQKLTRHRLLSQVLTESWDWAGRTFKLAPEEPATVIAALTRAWGADTTRNCIRTYLEGVAAGRLPGKRAGYLADLKALCDN